MVETGGGTARIAFEGDGPVVTPGQVAVFYRGDEVVGGGWIERALTREEAAA